MTSRRKVARRTLLVQFMRLSIGLSIAGLSAACAAAPSQGGPTGMSAPQAPAQPTAAPSVQPAGEKVVLKLGSVTSQAHHMYTAFQDFAKRVAEKTNGRVEVQIFPSAQLGGERDYIENMSLGALDMSQISLGVAEAFEKKFMALSLPYLYKDDAHFSRIVDSPVVAEEILSASEAKGFKILAVYDNTPRSIYNNVRPIRVPEDLKGLKIRTLESPVLLATLNALGATAVPMAYAELYTAIKQGTVDGADNAAGNVLADKFYEVTKYFSLTEHVRPPGGLCISSLVFQKLPKEIQEALVQAARENAPLERQNALKAQQEALEELRAKGMEINPVDKGPFRQAVASVYERFEKEIGQDLVQKLLAIA